MFDHTRSPAGFADVDRRLLSGGMDGTVRLWEISTCAEIACFRVPAEEQKDNPAVFQVGFSPDGRSAVSAHFDGVVRLWELPDAADSGS